jgi:ferredoxin-NADP reductase
METQTVKIKSIEKITHDVLRIETTKPVGYHFIPGQATEISINKTGWQKEKRPFTFTCLPEKDYLEFCIKTYPAHHGVTNELLNLKKEDELILHEVFGAITYQKEGVFIAGGAGVTPFIAIFRQLQKTNQLGHNMLVFGNKTKADIILEVEFREMLGDAFINILSDEKVEGYQFGLISEDFLKANLPDFNNSFMYAAHPL